MPESKENSPLRIRNTTFASFEEYNYAQVRFYGLIGQRSDNSAAFSIQFNAYNNLSRRLRSAEARGFPEKIDSSTTRDGFCYRNFRMFQVTISVCRAFLTDTGLRICSFLCSHRISMHFVASSVDRDSVGPLAGRVCVTTHAHENRIQSTDRAIKNFSNAFESVRLQLEIVKSFQLFAERARHNLSTQSLRSALKCAFEFN